MNCVYTADPVAGFEAAVRGLKRGSRERMEAVVSYLKTLSPQDQDAAYHGAIGIGHVRPDERIDLRTRTSMKRPQ